MVFQWVLLVSLLIFASYFPNIKMLLFAAVLVLEPSKTNVVEKKFVWTGKEGYYLPCFVMLTYRFYYSFTNFWAC